MKPAAAIFMALASVGACAQTTQNSPASTSNVSLYGIIDAALVGESGGAAGHLSKITSGAASASRFGLRGSEDLGGGLSALFILEAGTKIDTGEIDAAGTIFNRQALVGLKSSQYGMLALGRQYTPYHTTLVNIVDPFNTGYAGSSKNLFPDWGTNIRSSNTVTYASPRVAGYDAELAYSMGEQSVASAGRQIGAAVGYTQGSLAVRLAYNSKNADTPASTGVAPVSHDLGRNVLLGANYDFRWIKLHAGFAIDRGYNAAPLGNSANPYGGVKPTASTNGREWLLGFSAPCGNGSLLFSAMHKDDRTSFNQDASAWGIGYLYNLSKRTSLYTAYGHISNKHGAGYTVANNTEAGTGNTGYNLGIRHTF